MMTETKRIVLALAGVAIMLAAAGMMWRSVLVLWQPLPIWKVALLVIGGTLIIAADPVSYTAGRTRRY